MKKTLRKTFNRVDRGKCDIKYIGEKLQAELGLDYVAITSHLIIVNGEEEVKQIKMMHKDRPDDDVIEWVMPGGWVLDFSPELNNESCLIYDLMSEHYR